MRSRTRGILIGATTTVALGLAVAAFAAPTPEEIEVGKRRYMKYCATCHGPTGTGDGYAASTFVKKPANLTLLAKQNGGKFPVGEVIGIVKGDQPIAAHGSREMPVWADILGSPMSGEYTQTETDLKILTIVNYLETIQQK